MCATAQSDTWVYMFPSTCFSLVMLGDFRLSALAVRLHLYLVRGAALLLGIGMCLPVAQPQQWLVATCDGDRSPAAHHRRRLRNANVSVAHQLVSSKL